MFQTIINDSLMISFIDVIKNYLATASEEDVLEVKAAILHATPNFTLKEDVIKYIQDGELLRACKHVKETTGMQLKDCKLYVDAVKEIYINGNGN